ncbi:beta-hydroxyacid dehydrogenase, 3-hydroxyisobutyrate dehydrogenase [Caldisphaera lagunensis DSM 15908]|uniref:Beta-hydroxyacid dehydrogenase, 3-hydroxyisobutyrate dehydrogenase n=1 Tax=Caldisphaera lagunensis (strain DSM 15908 / JCM 11604 / ANMR 0165 / IC-154) TaxID=1056495 RepID=L0AAP1_CALLD|nr:NAD(P)-dependent oxidoreductase [Caldisphaera lagunensis]AFZ70494.1 beta-hydroxyacid dehydrogenase, 3-hydroxyisobutyrate dehydrogenase [Caldisphaera lagunensis DSM 15908]
MTVRIAVLGTGNMGSAIAERLANTGFTIFLWNRTIDKAKSLASKINATVYETPWRAIENADVAITLVSDDNALYDIISQMRRSDGLLFINSSTITPKASMVASKQLKELGACYVEAPIIGNPHDLIQGNVIFLVAGERNCVRYSMGILMSAGKIIEIEGESYKASIAKLIYNSMLISSIQLLSESLTLADAYGISQEKVKEIMENTIFKQFVGKYLDRIINENHPTSFKISLAAKDLEYANSAAFDANLVLPLIRTSAQTFKQADIFGLNESDYTKIFNFINPKKFKKISNSNK